MKFTRPTPYFFFFTLLLFLFSCELTDDEICETDTSEQADETNRNSYANSDSVILQANAYHIPAKDSFNIVAFNENELILDKNKYGTFQLGDVVNFGPNNRMPYGGLVKITGKSTQGAFTTYTVVDADLTEYFQNLEVSHTTYLKGPEFMEEFNDDLIIQKSASGGEIFRFNMSDYVLYDEDGDEETKGDQISVNGWIQLIEPIAHFDHKISDGEIKHLKTSFTGKIAFELNLNFNDFTKLDMSLEKQVYDIPLSKILYRAGGVSGILAALVLQPSFTFDVKAILEINSFLEPKLWGSLDYVTLAAYDGESGLFESFYETSNEEWDGTFGNRNSFVKDYTTGIDMIPALEMRFFNSKNNKTNLSLPVEQRLVYAGGKNPAMKASTEIKGKGELLLPIVGKKYGIDSLLHEYTWFNGFYRYLKIHSKQKFYYDNGETNTLIAQVVDEGDHPVEGVRTEFITYPGAKSLKYTTDEDGKVEILWTPGSLKDSAKLMLNNVEQSPELVKQNTHLFTLMDENVVLLKLLSSTSFLYEPNTAYQVQLVATDLENIPLPNVAVKFTELSSGNSTTILSDANGQLNFPWNPESENEVLHINLKEEGHPDYVAENTHQVSLVVPNFRIGDRHQGGIIYYIDKTGEHGFICADSAIRNTGGADAYKAEWGCMGAHKGTLEGASTTANTNAAAECAPKFDTGKSAARMALDYSSDGFSDWVLPNEAHMRAIYQNLVTTDKVNWTNPMTRYWLSYEYDKDRAYFYDFSGGYASDITKVATLLVLPIRAF